MFVHSERFPTGSPLPQGYLTPAPWILKRLAPYPPFEAACYGRIELDAATQTARYFGVDGTPITVGGHATSTGTNPPTGTTGQGDRQGDRQGGDAPDADSGNDGDQ